MPDIIKDKESNKAPICRFRTIYNFGDTSKFSQDLSRETEVIHELKDGRPTKVGETNIYEKIQASKEQCEIYNILGRYEAGDYSVIKDPNTGAMYGDFSEVSTNMLDSINNMDKAINNWNSLPKALRAMYDNDVSKFIKASPEEISKSLNDYANSLLAKDEKNPDGGDK